MEEIWKDVEGYEGLYSVSNLGRVKSHDRISKRGKGYAAFQGKILIPHEDNNGYLFVSLFKDMKSTRYRIHRIVAKSFIKNPINYNIVNHLDGNKLNNRVDNLEWTTKRLNEIHASKLGLLKRSGETKKKMSESKKVSVIGKNLNTGEIIRLDGMCDGKKFGFTKSGIFKCCSGQRLTHHGFSWEYKDKTLEVNSNG